MGSVEEAGNVLANRGPGGLVEIWHLARGTVGVHCPTGKLDLRDGERIHESCGICLRLVSVEAVNIEIPGCRRLSAQNVGVVGSERSYLAGVG